MVQCVCFDSSERGIKLTKHDTFIDAAFFKLGSWCLILGRLCACTFMYLQLIIQKASVYTFSYSNVSVVLTPYGVSNHMESCRSLKGRQMETLLVTAQSQNTQALM